MRIATITIAATVLIGLGATVHAAGVTIEQSGQQFSEKSVALKPGDALTFANKDDVSHNITVVNDDDDTADLAGRKSVLHVRQGRALQGSVQHSPQHEISRIR